MRMLMMMNMVIASICFVDECIVADYKNYLHSQMFTLWVVFNFSFANWCIWAEARKRYLLMVDGKCWCIWAEARKWYLLMVWWEWRGGRWRAWWLRMFVWSTDTLYEAFVCIDVYSTSRYLIGIHWCLMWTNGEGDDDEQNDHEWSFGWQTLCLSFYLTYANKCVRWTFDAVYLSHIF